ncbi:MAG: phage tail assembly chaperone [Hyphomicrobiaceae bacterium]|nr:phage tail assembly chaperone [Hyphomicrobiaceae bacterium]
MAAGLGVLRLPPREFWAMTPRELSAALTGALGLTGGKGQPSRGDLAGLMQRYPDAPGNDKES